MNTRSPAHARTVVLSMLIALLCLLQGLPAAQPRQTVAAPEPAPLATDSHQSEPNPQKNEVLDQSAWEAWEALPVEYKRKVDPRILAELQGDVVPAHLGGGPEMVDDPAALPPAPRQPRSETRFIVHLRSAADLDALLQTQVFASAVEQRSAVFRALVSESQSSQSALVSVLEAQRAVGNVSTYQSFFIVNALAVDGGLATIVDLARRFDVERIAANYPLVPLWDTQEQFAHVGPPAAERVAQQSADVEWNIALVGADAVWSNLGVSGAGAVVAGFDTGVDYAHPALVEQYRGNNGGSFNHNYSWFEPDGNLYPDGNLGQSVSDEPRDCDSHGTHTMGTMVGRHAPNEPYSYGVGMAPNARWIALPGICYNTMPGGIGDDIGGLKAFQWLLCPTDLSGDLRTADCSKAPHAVNNSWGSANPVDDTFRPAIQALRAAGVAPVFAAGNPAAGEGSIAAPANIPEAITVGATDRADEVAYFSGRGPSFYEGEQKPELSAPGVDVLSTVPGNYYYASSGTSMAAPHVAGLVALMVSADLRDGVRDFDVDELERFMMATAVDLGEPGPDNDYGYGRINAYEAVRAVLTAGDLRGRVIDAETGEPIPGPLVTGVALDSSSRFTALGFSPARDVPIATGSYSLTVPAGNYDITVDAWGYASDTFPRQVVFPGTLSVADFALSPLPRHTVSGIVRTGEAAEAGYPRQPAVDGPVADARVRVVGSPNVEARTGADGAYSLELPVGTHTLRIEAAHHRVITETVAVDAANVSLDLRPPAAPSILLIDANAFEGWFYGWPIHPFFEFALDRSGYVYDLWRIEDISVTDVSEEEEQPLRGVPSFETLNQYDVVIWMQSGCGYCYVGSPNTMGADPALTQYLDAGGRLILSGQDLGYLADGTSTLYDDYLHADLRSHYAASQGEEVFGLGFLADLALEITNASVYGYANGVIDLSPDAVIPSGDRPDSYPVLTYDNDEGAAALAVDPCVGSHRALYFSVGYENLGPRADNRSPAFAEVMGRSLQWLGGTRAELGLELRTEAQNRTAPPGQTAFHHVNLVNSGKTPLDVQMSLAEAAWSARIYSGTVTSDTNLGLAPELTGQVVPLAPCQVRTVTVAVDVPLEVQNGAADDLLFTATGARSDNTPTDLTAQAELQTTAFANWRIRTSSSIARERLGVAAPPDDVYVHALGGIAKMLSPDGYYYYYAPSASHERYNACIDVWEAAAPLPAPRANMATAMLDGKIYLMGGTNDSYYTVNSTLVYDPGADAWSEAAGLPVALAGASAAVAHGKIYVFGGSDYNYDHVDTTYMYDPATGAWTELAPMPEGGRAYTAAATLNGKIYVVGGWPNLKRVEIYDPSTDRWAEGPSTEFGRQSPGLVGGLDGYLYLMGGGSQWDGAEAVERLDPATNRWESISPLNDGNRAGTGAALAAGQIFVVGGEGSVLNTESLTLGTSFCLSDKTVDTGLTQPGGQLAYEVRLQSEPAQAVQARVRDELPANTSFGGFTKNEVGAVYNSDTHQIHWNGTLDAGAAPAGYAYTVLLNSEGWTSGESITSIATFRGTRDGKSPLRFERTNTSRVFEPDFSASSVETDRNVAIRSERLRYTIELESRTVGGGTVRLHDPLPPGLNYVPNSLQSANGTGGYDPATGAVDWTGQVLAGQGGLFNDTGDYVWVDSEGDQSISGPVTPVPFAWQDIRDTGTFITTGDDLYLCGFPIGFAFPYYDVEESTFCVGTNGFLSFDEAGYGYQYGSCLPNPGSTGAIIAPLWTDLVVYGGIHYQTFGTAPNRSLVVQWTDAPYYYAFSGESNTFQLILYENGTIDVHLLETDTVTNSYVSIGVSDHANTRGNSYHCDINSELMDERAVRFVPPGSALSGAKATVSFDVLVGDDTPVNSEITNTIYITSAEGSYQRSVTTALNPLSLANSHIDVLQEQVNSGEPVELQFVVRNSGQLTATDASLVHPLDEALSYVADSVSCGRGECFYQDGQIAWRGVVPARGQTTVRYAAIPSAQLPDRSSLTATARVEDGHGSVYTLQKSFITRSSDLAASTARLVPPFVGPGSISAYEMFVHNVGAIDAGSTLTLPLPAGLSYIDGSLVCGTGTCTIEGKTLHWSGTVAARSAIPIRFRVQVPADAPYGQSYVFEATLTDEHRSESLTYGGALTVAHNNHLAILFIPSQGITLYLPLVAQENGQLSAGALEAGREQILPREIEWRDRRSE